MPEDTRRTRTELVIVRRVLLGGLVLWGGWVLLFHGLPQVCHDAVSGKRVVSLCEPMAVTDPRAVLFLLVAVLLLFGELSEMEIAGVLTLKRRLEQAKAEVAEVRSEIGQIRTQAAVGFQAALRNQVGIYIGDKSARSGRALRDATRGRSGILDETETLGAYAQVAVEAGLAGLISLLPGWASRSMLLGYTLSADLRLCETFAAGNQDSEVLRTAKPDVSPSRTGAHIELHEGCRVLTAPSYDDRGRVVGAMAVLVLESDLPEGADADDEVRAGMAAAVTIAAGAYARLIVDILGE